MARESATTKAWRERAQAAESLTTAYERVLGALAMGEKPYAVEPDHDGGEYALWFPTAPDGGVLVHTFRFPGQRAQVRAAMFADECAAMSPAWRLNVREAISRLKEAQYRAFNDSAA